jgi:UDP-2,4-diacetamido-2,4,6-trideoxy-beta-L-altropyranose hydrolase
MKIIIRADSSFNIGSGHIMRCLTLATELSKRGHFVEFVCRELPGNLIHYIEHAGFTVYTLPYNTTLNIKKTIYESLNEIWEEDARLTKDILKRINARIVILDHYSFDEKWENEIYQYVNQILVIDDLENRKHNCDFLLDQNFFFLKKNRYIELLDQKTMKLFGPSFALLRDEFLLNRKKIEDKSIKNILIYFGASDITQETKKVLKALINLSSTYELIIDVIIGISNREYEELKREFSMHKHISFYTQTNEFSSFMKKADLCIGAGGSTTWERCCIGLPSIVIPVAENQIIPMKELNKANAIILMEATNDFKRYEEKIKSVLDMPVRELQKICKAGFAIFDGLGVKRVADILEGRGI